MSDQTVAEETNAKEAAVEKRTDDVADLDSLLAEFDQATQKPAVPQPEPVKQPALDNEAIASIKLLENRVREEDISKSVSVIFRDIKWDNDMKRAYLVSQANKNPAIEKAFQNRLSDPGTWQRFEKSLAKEIDKKYPDQFPKVDEDATADRFAVAQAVRGASTKVAAEPPPDFTRMSNQEFERWKMDNMK